MGTRWGSVLAGCQAIALCAGDTICSTFDTQIVRLEGQLQAAKDAHDERVRKLVAQVGSWLRGAPR